VSRGQRDGSLQPYSRLSRPDEYATLRKKSLYAQRHPVQRSSFPRLFNDIRYIDCFSVCSTTSGIYTLISPSVQRQPVYGLSLRRLLNNIRYIHSGFPVCSTTSGISTLVSQCVQHLKYTDSGFPMCSTRFRVRDW
jgi:hypothetical protein